MTRWTQRYKPLTHATVVSLAIASLAVLTLIAAPAKATSSLDASIAPDSSWTHLAYGVELVALAGYHRQTDDLSRTEDRAFRGIGAIVCTVGARRRSSTAFLVGTFDIAVTVAHTFESNGSWARSSDCVYHSADRRGQIRERIPIAYFKAQWREDPSAFGEPTKDLAMVRLSRASRFASRTLSFSKFSGTGAPVTLIGFRSDPDFEPLKHKRSGTLFAGDVGNMLSSDLPRLMHDVDTRGLASGAPLLDQRDGVVIGIHARVANKASLPAAAGSMPARRNAMLVMTEWLERVLRAEISQLPASAAGEQATAR